MSLFGVDWASAATFTVNSTADVVDVSPGDAVCETALGNGVCTLRGAIQEANSLAGADTIDLPAGTYLLSIPGINEDEAEEGDLDITEDLTLAGAGSATTVVDGGGIDRVFDVQAVAADLSGLRVQNGDAQNKDGGGFRTAGALTLTEVFVANNLSDGSGGGIHADGAAATLVLTDVTVSDNWEAGRVPSFGGGIFFANSLLPIQLTDVTVSGNSATNTGGGLDINNGSGTLSFTRVTVSGNTSDRGAGLHLDGSLAKSLTNVTFSGNSAADQGGGLYLKGSDPALMNVTFSGNSATDSGAALYNTNVGPVALTNTLIANSTGSGNCFGMITDNGFNLADDATCSTIPATLTGLDPTLADNGGPTRTHALLAGSNAIDAGTNSGCPSDDQRGYLRSDGTCDVGAYEFGAALPVTLAAFRATSSVGGTLLEWTTATEIRSAGFNLYALTEDGWKKVNRRLIPSQGDTVEPQSYRFEASGVEGEWFVLEELDVRGKPEVHGPFALGEAYGNSEVPAEPIDWQAIGAEHRAKELARGRAAGFVDRQSSPRGSASALSGSALPVLAPTARAARPVPGYAVGLELLVDETGLYRVTYEVLRAAGLDLLGAPADELALESRGAPVPIYVQTGLGGYDGAFGPGAFFEFSGEALDTLYTKTNVYRLSVDRRKARRIEAKVAPPALGPPAPFYLERLEVERNLRYNLTSPADDPWFDTRLLAYGGPAAATVDLVVDGYLAGAAPAGLSVEMWGLSGWPENPDHHVEVGFNGAPLAEEYFDDRVVHSVTVELPADVLQEGTNSLELRLPGDTGAAWDMVALDRFGVTYPRQFLARQGRLAFEAAARVFRVEGLPSPDVVVYRLERSRAVRLAGARVEPSGAGYAVTFAGLPDPARYLVAAAEALRVPGLRPARSGRGITQGRAEYLVISHPDFLAGLEPLLKAREGQGLEVRVVDVEEVYGRFSHGIFDPAAIRAYIAHAAQRMGTKHVLLVGGDSYDYHDYLGQGAISFLPSIYADTGDGVRFAPVDPLYADVDGDGIQDLALGRFPVRTEAELETVTSKTLDYAVKGYPRSGVFAADAFDIAAGRSFSEVSDGFIAQLPAGWTVERAYIDDLGVNGAHEALTASINEGVALTSYFGHSAPTVWSFQNLFNATDAAELTNFRAPTVVTQWGCWNTYHVTPKFNTMGHKLLLSGEQGAAAVLGASTLTQTASDIALGALLMPKLVGPGTTLGEAVRDAKQELAKTHPQKTDVLLGWTLLGDPALIIEP